MRRCGECQLCCTLPPLLEMSKPANTRCPHQKFGKGCTIYAGRPEVCRLWSCRWLMALPGTEHLARPDRARYCIDPMADFVSVVPDDGSGTVNVEVVQIWCDPKRRGVHREPSLRRYLETIGKPGLARYEPGWATFTCPPHVFPNQAPFWQETVSRCTKPSFASQMWRTGKI